MSPLGEKSISLINLGASLGLLGVKWPAVGARCIVQRHF